MADTISSLATLSKVSKVTKTSRMLHSTGSPTHMTAARAVDEVKLTRTLESLEAISKSLAEGHAVDWDKIDTIKASIASGEYKVSPNRVAAKFAELEKMLNKA